MLDSLQEVHAELQRELKILEEQKLDLMRVKAIQKLKQEEIDRKLLICQTEQHKVDILEKNIFDKHKALKEDSKLVASLQELKR